jgi:thiol-disulfide isomerase/thioredoxin
MHILHINSKKDVYKIDKFIKNGSDVFIIVYMEGCGPCNATRPEWEKIESALKHQYAKNDKLVVIDVNKDYLPDIKHIGAIDGFPTMKYIGANGSIIESYENSSIKKKDRSVSSFINWIESKINNLVSTTPTSSVHHVYKRIDKTRKHHYNRHNKTRHHNKRYNKGKKIYKGGKWSKKYKSSINCSRPKGFSQKQYCKYK